LELTEFKTPGECTWRFYVGTQRRRQLGRRGLAHPQLSASQIEAECANYSKAHEDETPLRRVKSLYRIR